MHLLTINEAAALAGKSIQTIRRMIKQKKVTVKRQKTPQGFNYLIIKDSLIKAIQNSEHTGIQNDPAIQVTTREHRPIKEELGELFKQEAQRFNSTIQKLIDQHKDDKENFFNLIKTFQDRVVTLEGQIKLLETGKRTWWRFWK